MDNGNSGSSFGPWAAAFREAAAVKASLVMGFFVTALGGCSSRKPRPKRWAFVTQDRITLSEPHAATFSSRYSWGKPPSVGLPGTTWLRSTNSPGSFELSQVGQFVALAARAREQLVGLVVAGELLGLGDPSAACGPGRGRCSSGGRPSSRGGRSRRRRWAACASACSRRSSSCAQRPRSAPSGGIFGSVAAQLDAGRRR